MRINGNVDHFRTGKLLKDIFSKLDQNTLSQVKYCISVVFPFSVSKAIVEQWGPVIENVFSNKIAFKEADSTDITKMTEKVVFIKLVAPSPGAASNRKLFKRALILMYGGIDFATHFTVNSGKGFTSKGVGRITSGREEDSIFR